jgi:hypothetical protein
LIDGYVRSLGFGFSVFWTGAAEVRPECWVEMQIYILDCLTDIGFSAQPIFSGNVLGDLTYIGVSDFAERVFGDVLVDIVVTREGLESIMILL